MKFKIGDLVRLTDKRARELMLTDDQRKIVALVMMVRGRRDDYDNDGQWVEVEWIGGRSPMGHTEEGLHGWYASSLTKAKP